MQGSFLSNLLAELAVVNKITCEDICTGYPTITFTYLLYAILPFNKVNTIVYKFEFGTITEEKLRLEELFGQIYCPVGRTDPFEACNSQTNDVKIGG